MATLLFTPRTTLDANLFQYRLDNSIFHAEWNAWTGAYEFQEKEETIDQLEEDLLQSIAFDIDGRFESKS